MTEAARAPAAAPSGAGLLLALGGAIAFSGKAIIVKLAYRHGVDAVTLLMLRMLLALPLFLGLAWWAGRGRPPLSPRERWAVIGLGFSGYYLASFLDFAGLAYISASFERLILYLNPTLVLLLGWLLLGRPLSYALYLLYSGEEVHRLGAMRLTGLATSVACLLCVGQYLLLRGPGAIAQVPAAVLQLSALN